MKAKQVLILCGIACVLFTATILFITSARQKPASDSKETILVSDTVVYVDHARSLQEIIQGLSGHEPLESNQGMLFDLRHHKKAGITPSFWMKDMLFDLDMVWIDQGSVVYIHENVPAPKNANDPLPSYSPNGPVEYVLEVPSGWIKRNNISIGDRVKI